MCVGILLDWVIDCLLLWSGGCINGFVFVEQILQCLSVQGLTSSGGGGSTVGGDGGNSSGVSRALVKERLIFCYVQVS